MRFPLSYIFILLNLLFVVSCKPHEYTYRVITNEKINQTDSGTVFMGEIISDNIKGITEFGFVWSTSEDFSEFEKISITDDILTGTNSIYTESNFIYGIPYYLKAFIIAENKLIYGDIISFSGKNIPGILIKSFSPSEGTWRDSINIYGTNFENEINPLTKLLIGEKQITFKILNDSIIRTSIPDELVSAESTLKLCSLYDTTRSTKSFRLLPPEITSFNPLVGERGSTVNIIGKYFHPVKDYNSIQVGDYRLEILNSDVNHLSSYIPQSMVISGSYAVIVNCGNQNTIAIEKYTHTELWTGLSTGQVTVSRVYPVTEITFTANNKCYKGIFNDFQSRLGKCQNYISEYNPQTNQYDVVYYYIDYYQMNIAIYVADNKIYLKRNLAISLVDIESQLLREKKTFPGSNSNISFGFTLDNMGYIYANNGELWKYNSEVDSWTQLSNVPEGICLRHMEIDGISYVLLGIEDNSYNFYSYNSTTDQWTLLQQLLADEQPMKFIASGSWLGYNHKGYCITYELINNSDNCSYIYHFDPSSCNWSKHIGIPNFTSGIQELQYGSGIYIYAINKIWTSGDTYSFKTWKYNLIESIP